jgi:hypothetical protein
MADYSGCLQPLIFSPTGRLNQLVKFIWGTSFVNPYNYNDQDFTYCE